MSASTGGGISPSVPPKSGGGISPTGPLSAGGVISGRVGAGAGESTGGGVVPFFLFCFKMNFFFCSPKSEISSSFSCKVFNSLAIRFNLLRA